MLIHDILVRNARIHPERIALAAGEDTVTYRELFARVLRRSASLKGLGIGKEDRVAVLMRSSIPYMELLYAIPMAGAAMVPLNEQMIARELSGILQQADAGLLLFSEEFQDVADAVRKISSSAVRFVRVEEIPREDFKKIEEADPWGEPFRDFPSLSDSDIALLVYTGGISGIPRGAMLSHGNLTAASASAALELGLSRNDVYLSCTPLPFMTGTGRLLRFQHMGGTVVILEEFDPEEVLRTIEHRKITHLLLTPAMIARILDFPAAPDFNLATLRTVLYGGTWIPVDLQKRAIKFFRCGMVQSYGLVETAGVLTFLHPEDHSLEEGSPYMRTLMSVGKEAIGVEVRVVDEHGNRIAPDRIGEITARGPNVFKGYFRDPAYTSFALRNGWLYTGDMASVDEKGYIYIVERKRDALSVGGIWVYPREIEDILTNHPAVKESAVIGRPDYLMGEIPVAVVALKEGSRADASDILSHCRGNMAPFKVPHSVEFVSSLPRNSQGKVLKVKLKEKAVPFPTRRKPPR